MKKAVDAQAARYLPDFTYRSEVNDSLLFSVVPIHEMVGDLAEPDCVGLRIQHPDPNITGDTHYLTNDWSRHQLLQAVGTKEKWFESVPLETQAEELNRRRHVLHNMKFRLMYGGDEATFPVRPVRGIVSSEYMDIPNTEIMQALLEILPDDTAVLERFSGETDKAFYVHVVLNHPIGLPGKREGYPGLLFRNSEVGYTSLWVIPFLLLPMTDGHQIWTHRIAVMHSKYLLRRTHRGRFNDLKEKLKESLEKASPLWKSLGDKIPAMSQMLYADEDDALEAMSHLIISSKGGTKLFALRCRQAYKAFGHRTHSAYTLFETIVQVAGEDLNHDQQYDNNAVAGAILLKLVL